MTRINVGIEPYKLCDQMLRASHYEIVRVPNSIKSGRAKIEDIPEEFNLGRGSVKFFYDKLLYLKRMYFEVHNECIDRGFEVQDFSSSFEDLPPELMNDWLPDRNSLDQILDRIKSRLKTMKEPPRYCGKIEDIEFFIHIL